MREDSRQRIAQETLDIYAPLAHRLGIDWMRQELDELAFRALKPEALRGAREAAAFGLGERARYVEEVIGVLSEKLAARVGARGDGPPQGYGVDPAEDERARRRRSTRSTT